jgi:hypothetical protein
MGPGLSDIVFSVDRVLVSRTERRDHGLIRPYHPPATALLWGLIDA